jgi:hypothetical protein
VSRGWPDGVARRAVDEAAFDQAAGQPVELAVAARADHGAAIDPAVAADAEADADGPRRAAACRPAGVVAVADAAGRRAPAGLVEPEPLPEAGAQVPVPLPTPPAPEPLPAAAIPFWAALPLPATGAAGTGGRIAIFGLGASRGAGLGRRGSSALFAVRLGLGRRRGRRRGFGPALIEGDQRRAVRGSIGDVARGEALHDQERNARLDHGGGQARASGECPRSGRIGHREAPGGDGRGTKQGTIGFRRCDTLYLIRIKLMFLTCSI